MRKLILLPFLLSFSAFAMNEIECDSPYPQQNLQFEISIDRPMSPTPWRRGHVTIYENGQAIKATHYDLAITGSANFGRIRLWGEGLDLDIDLWPDSVPRWGRSYRTTYRSIGTLNNLPFDNIECRFPWAN